ncbi:MAG: ribosome maturation factor RimP [Clostridia bacterium]|nr:ribosome maturation factor RimP [Clostridia bacterium]
MAYSKLELKILDLAKPIAEENDCYIYDLEYLKEGKSRTLRIFADKEGGGISLDECEAISRKLSEELDKKDPIPENYMLEVSSPGIERRLRNPEHFSRYIGETIDIGLYKAENGSKTLSGKLVSFEDGKITLETESGNVSIMQSETTGVKLHFDF